jgi:hypothetical protein
VKLSNSLPLSELRYYIGKGQVVGPAQLSVAVANSWPEPIVAKHSPASVSIVLRQVQVGSAGDHRIGDVLNGDRLNVVNAVTTDVRYREGTGDGVVVEAAIRRIVTLGTGLSLSRVAEQLSESRCPGLALLLSSSQLMVTSAITGLLSQVGPWVSSMMKVTIAVSMLPQLSAI